MCVYACVCAHMTKYPRKKKKEWIFRSDNILIASLFEPSGCSTATGNEKKFNEFNLRRGETDSEQENYQHGVSSLLESGGKKERCNRGLRQTHADSAVTLGSRAGVLGHSRRGRTVVTATSLRKPPAEVICGCRLPLWDHSVLAKTQPRM